jgi:hypothetical protein
MVAEFGQVEDGAAFVCFSTAGAMKRTRVTCEGFRHPKANSVLLGAISSSRVLPLTCQSQNFSNVL